MIILDRIPVFIAVAEELSFSRAADKLGRTQSAVSQSVAQLEDELGVLLFLRDGRSIRLTKPGRLFYEQSVLSVNHMNRALKELRAWESLESGSLVIGSSHITAAYFLPPVLKEFHNRYPGVVLTVRTVLSDIASDELLKGHIDLAIGILPHTETAGVEKIELQPRRDMIVSSKDIFISTEQGRDDSLEELLVKQSFIIAAPGMQSRLKTDELFASFEHPPEVAMEVDHVEIMKKMILSGAGVGFLPEIAVADEMKKRTLYGLPYVSGRAPDMIGILTLPEQYHFPALKIFIELIRELYQAS